MSIGSQEWSKCAECREPNQAPGQEPNLTPGWRPNQVQGREPTPGRKPNEAPGQEEFRSSHLRNEHQDATMASKSKAQLYLDLRQDPKGPKMCARLPQMCARPLHGFPKGIGLGCMQFGRSLAGATSIRGHNECYVNWFCQSIFQIIFKF